MSQSVEDVEAASPVEANSHRFICEQCSKVLSSRDNLSRHLRSHSGHRFQCPKCDCVYSRKDALHRHMIAQKHEVSAIEFDFAPVNFRCCFCFDSFSDREQLILHLNSAHEQNVRKDLFSFSTEGAFRSWMSSLGNARYVNRKGTLISSSKTGLYYVCNRSKESSRTTIKQRTERPFRKAKSTKVDYNCLSAIHVAHVESRINVEYIDYHTCCDPTQRIDKKSLRLDNVTISEIESQVEQGLTVDRILANMRARFERRDTRDIEIQVGSNQGCSPCPGYFC
jgi:hypothetical protein